MDLRITANDSRFDAVNDSAETARQANTSSFRGSMLVDRTGHQTYHTKSLVTDLTSIVDDTASKAAEIHGSLCYSFNGDNVLYNLCDARREHIRYLEPSVKHLDGARATNQQLPYRHSLDPIGHSINNSRSGVGYRHRE